MTIMKMKKNIILLAAAIVCLSGCAKSASSGVNDAAKRYFDAWVKVNGYEACPRTALGSVIILDEPGTGKLVGESHDTLFVRLDYTISDLDGNITATTIEKVAQRVGTYTEGNYYGPAISYAGPQNISAGLQDAIKDMKVGGHRKVVVPGWLSTYNKHNTPEEYIASETGTDTVYDLKVVDVINNITNWEVDSVGRYLAKNYSAKYGTDPKKAAADSAGMHGFFFIKKDSRSGSICKDTTVYINYIGRLLNGQVFDTTIRDTAVKYGIYSSGKTYEPVSISCAEKYDQFTMGSEESSMIAGFAYGLSKMAPFGKGTAIFISQLGYSYSGSGNSIPAYSPLQFDLEIVDED